MRIEDLTRTWIHFRKKPLLTSFLLILLALIAGLSIWVTGFLGEKGKIAASKSLQVPENQKALKQTQLDKGKSTESPLSDPLTTFLPEMVKIPAGTFLFGDPMATTISRKHLATYWISRYEITNTQYKRYIKENPKAIKPPPSWEDNNFNAPQKPVVCVSWFESLNYCQWLSKKTGLNYSLPTQEQWEKAARGLTNSIYPWGDSLPTTKKANFNNPYGYPQIVSAYAIGKSRSFGIYNMAGNVAEWCTNTSLDAPLVKGGSFRDGAHALKIQFFNEIKPDGLPWVGFRVVRSE